MTPDDNSPATRIVGRWRFQAEIDAEIAKERQAEEARISKIREAEPAEKAAYERERAFQQVFRAERERSAERKAQSPLREDEGDSERAHNVVLK